MALDLDLYKKYHGNTSSIGQRHRQDTLTVMENTWERDNAYCKVYVYDYYGDNEPEIAYGLSPASAPKKVAIDAKYVINTYNSDDKAQVSYHIIFRPSQKHLLDELSDEVVKRCGIPHAPTSIYPIGLYIDIPDEDDVYRRYIIVYSGNSYDYQMPSWSVFPCDERFMWVTDGKIYKVWGSKRTISNYDSGVWEDHRTEIANDQQKFVVPYFDHTATLYYNLRMIVSVPMKIPLTWRVSKVDSITPKGVAKITLLQDKFDQNYDYVGYDDNGNYIGLANYYGTKLIEDMDIASDEKATKEYTGVITYKGISPSIKIGGSAKEFTVVYYDVDGNVVTFDDLPIWTFVIDGSDISELFKLNYNGNSISAKFVGNEEYADSIVVVSAVCNDVIAVIKMELVL